MPPHTMHGPLLTVALCVAACGIVAPAAAAQEESRRYQNLQVLPDTISQDELADVMLANLRGLGLPRLAGEGCLFCHVGDMERPRSEWDYASDDKPTKRKARIMMAMVRAINGEHLSRLNDRIDTTLRVTCYTCHAGRTDPRPLPDVVLSAYAAGGVDSAAVRYGDLRRRYFGSDAYDFRVGVLAGVAAQLLDRGALDDAIALAAVEREVYPDSGAAVRSWMQMMLLRTMNTSGIDAALAELDRMQPDLGPDVVTPSLLDGLAWWLYRRDRQPDAIALMHHNRARFPDEYVPNESVAFVLRASGDRAGAERILEEWLARHPDHARARQLLINMRGR